jgi:hypothetical protein
MMTAGRVRDHIAIWLTKQLRDEQTIIDCERDPKMLDVPLFTRHPLYAPRLHSFPKTAAQGRSDGRGKLSNFNHSSENISSIVVCVPPTCSLMKRAGDLANKAIGKKVSLR